MTNLQSQTITNQFEKMPVWAQMWFHNKYGVGKIKRIKDLTEEEKSWIEETINLYEDHLYGIGDHDLQNDEWIYLDYYHEDLWTDKNPEGLMSVIDDMDCDSLPEVFEQWDEFSKNWDWN